MLKLSAIQMCSAPNVKENLKSIELQLTSLVNLNRQDKHLVVLPECCLFFGGKETQQLKLAQQDNSKEYLTQSLAGLAKKYQLTLVAGTIPLLAKCGHKFFNSSYVFSPKGEILGSYDKIHLLMLRLMTMKKVI